MAHLSRGVEDGHQLGLNLLDLEADVAGNLGVEGGATLVHEGLHQRFLRVEAVARGVEHVQAAVAGDDVLAERPVTRAAGEADQDAFPLAVIAGGEELLDEQVEVDGGGRDVDADLAGGVREDLDHLLTGRVARVRGEGEAERETRVVHEHAVGVALVEPDLRQQFSGALGVVWVLGDVVVHPVGVDRVDVRVHRNAFAVVEQLDHRVAVH